MAIEQIEKMLNREKYSSIFEEVIFMGEDKYLKYIKENKKKKWPLRLTVGPLLNTNIIA